MINAPKQKTSIGSVEHIAIPLLGGGTIPARIDTGARTSSIWVSSAARTAKGLAVKFFDTTSPFYTDQIHCFEQYDTIVVASSNGHAVERFKIKMRVMIAGRTINASFTLADRSTQVYPVLIGRNILRGKFIVDVSAGSPLIELEKAREAQLNTMKGKI